MSTPKRVHHSTRSPAPCSMYGKMRKLKCRADFLRNLDWVKACFEAGEIADMYARLNEKLGMSHKEFFALLGTSDAHGRKITKIAGDSPFDESLDIYRLDGKNRPRWEHVHGTRDTMREVIQKLAVEIQPVAQRNWSDTSQADWIMAALISCYYDERQETYGIPRPKFGPKDYGRIALLARQFDELALDIDVDFLGSRSLEELSDIANTEAALDYEPESMEFTCIGAAIVLRTFSLFLLEQELLKCMVPIAKRLEQSCPEKLEPHFQAWKEYTGFIVCWNQRKQMDKKQGEGADRMLEEFAKQRGVALGAFCDGDYHVAFLATRKYLDAVLQLRQHGILLEKDAIDEEPLDGMVMPIAAGQAESASSQASRAKVAKKSRLRSQSQEPLKAITESQTLQCDGKNTDAFADEPPAGHQIQTAQLATKARMGSLKKKSVKLAVKSQTRQRDRKSAGTFAIGPVGAVKRSHTEPAKKARTGSHNQNSQQSAARPRADSQRPAVGHGGKESPGKMESES